MIIRIRIGGRTSQSGGRRRPRRAPRAPRHGSSHNKSRVLSSIKPYSSKGCPTQMIFMTCYMFYTTLYILPCNTLNLFTPRPGSSGARNSQQSGLTARISHDDDNNNNNDNNENDNDNDNSTTNNSTTTTTTTTTNDNNNDNNDDDIDNNNTSTNDNNNDDRRVGAGRLVVRENVAGRRLVFAIAFKLSLFSGYYYY